MSEWLTESIILQVLVTSGLVFGGGLPAYFRLKATLAEINVETRAVAKDAKAAAYDAKEARTQVKNTHSTNLREEQDDRYAATMAALAGLARDLHGVREDNLLTRKDIGMLQSEDRVVRRDIQALRKEIAERIQ